MTRIGRPATAMFLAIAALIPAPAMAAQNDARSGGDAGDTFETATPVVPLGEYSGTLDKASGDRNDYYRFFLGQGSSVSVLASFSGTTDPVRILDPSGTPIDAGTRVAGVGVSASGTLSSEVTVRLAVHRALVAGEYRLHLEANLLSIGAYSLCFMNCESPRTAPNELIFGGSLRHADTQVLLVPPAHGDLGNPFGPTVADYVEATLRGIRRWETAMSEFAGDYPQFAYLRDISVEIEVFDGVTPVDPAGYDVVIGYVAAGPAFRGVAADYMQGDSQSFLDGLGLGDDVHYSGRTIALSLFGSSPRAGQALYDFPEINDLEIVTIHEFGHTFGLGHTTTWHSVLGPDLMNSPAPFVYGDGFPAGDGGERTSMKCLSSLNLYGMARLYRWLPDGNWVPSSGNVSLPPGIPYRWYC